MPTIGIIGAGRIGRQIARLAVENGYNVVISNSRGPETLSARRRARSKGPRGDRRRGSKGWRHCRRFGASKELPEGSGRSPGGQNRDRRRQLLP
jgi:NAD(P)-dependent dehydrogenase (short-subunit alcohol dehydrogenase family)